MKHILSIYLFTFLLTSSRSFHVIIPRSSAQQNHRFASLFMSGDDNESVVTVMVNGMPGPMAVAAAESCLKKGLKLAPVAMTGPDVTERIITVVDVVTGKYSNVRLIPNTNANMEEIVSSVIAQKEAIGAENFVAIDFTHPSAVNDNAKFYVKHQIPFVMGTTGGDRERLISDVQGHYCVIAPNMAKQIVALQAGLESLAKKYPGAFDGYQLHVVESHQKTKADTSGTAKAVVDSIKELANIPQYSYDDIELIRNDDESMQFGVSPEALKGHAFHTYTLSSADGSVQFVLKHNVEGRAIYADGTADAVKFLANIMKTDGSVPRVYNMIDVLEAGGM